MLHTYYSLLKKTNTNRYVYPIKLANEIGSLCKANQHVKSSKDIGTYKNCNLLDFNAFYAEIMARELLPYGDFKDTPGDGFKNACFYKVRQSDGIIVYRGDIMYKHTNDKGGEILKKYYMKLGDIYQRLGARILRERELMPEMKNDYMIFGCLFYGHNQQHKKVENFFAGSYLYGIAFNLMQGLVNDLKSKGAKVLNTSTDGILYTNLPDVIDSWKGYKLKNLKIFKLNYRGLNRLTGYDEFGCIIIDKHQGETIISGSMIRNMPEWLKEYL